MAIAVNLGFPRIGANRELKKAVEQYWAGKSSLEDLQSSARQIRQTNWQLQKESGVDQPPVGDFSYYDHVLDTAFLFDLIPQRFRDLPWAHDQDLYFAMARGRGGSHSLPALEMTKWFDTNYHYLVPELTGDERFELVRPTVVEQFTEATALGYTPRPVVLGPVSLLFLSKEKRSGSDRFDLLVRAVAGYTTLLRQLAAAGATWVQIDEPVLALDLDDATREAFRSCYQTLSQAAPRLKIFLATYFGPLLENLDLALHLPIHALHLDLIRGPQQLTQALHNAPPNLTLSLGLVDGRNIWKTDLARALEQAELAQTALSPDRVWIAPSCSLLHAPVDLSAETALPSEIRNWLAFARQKLEEVSVIVKALNGGRSTAANALRENAEAVGSRKTSSLVFRRAVRDRSAAIDPASFQRTSPHVVRAAMQQETLNLPPFPTTTIGSFPQTAELRAQRLRHKKKELTDSEYETFLRHEIEYAVRRQEEIGLDVLVHGEAERNDMVEYFAEFLDGFAFTANGWVQSYGSRCVKPPIIYGDVARRTPMTVVWWQFAQSLTPKPMKGMLTGPVTILQWSFVRDDQSRRDTCQQIAFAIRDEVVDLEAAGCRIIQIDEPALREGLPLRAAAASDYLAWAVDCFRLAGSGVHDATQIHTHMCYADFNDIIDAIAAMDADVISLESARSQMELLHSFVNSRYPNDLGPGVYDIHSPRVPDADEMTALLEKARSVFPAERLWVNPDCGLKTRRWEEVMPALTNLVTAAKAIRGQRQSI